MLGGAPADFVRSVVNMVAKTTEQPGHRVRMHTLSLSNLTVARNRMLDFALRKYDKVCWLDSDHKLPEDALLRLLAHDKPVVALNQPRRQLPITSTAFSSGVLVESSPDKHGLEEVESVGLAIFLMDMGVMDTLQRHADANKQPLWPLFKDVWTEGPIMLEGDRYFCSRLREAGIQIFIDHDLSRDCGHIAETVLHFPR